ncbi:MAG TPA: phospho-N-acetylmuramoyl-pentapeptide-transferase [Bryobacteraceae bacterium]|nr:phospho-N-acetylmuramoyl-pentapeptide-transferase [Bryobacteraceae bacterium]
MLYWLLYEQLYPRIGPFRVFRYVTARAMFASLTSLFLCVLLGPWLIRKLREFQIGQHIREDGPKSHQKKAGTPTMGGILIVVTILIPTLLWADLTHLYVWIAMFGLFTFAIIGFIDDYAKVMNKRNLGLTSGQKFALQLIVAAVITIVLAFMRHDGSYTTVLNVPFFKQFQPDLVIPSLLSNPLTYVIGFLPFYIFFVLVVVGASNAVNVTDGLDGLAIGLMVISASALTMLAYTSGNRELAQYLLLIRNPRTAELTIFCSSMVGASLGFLWWNSHPADIFMGDVGSLALGGAMGVVAVLIKEELLLLFIAGMFVVELVSVILQVGSYKLRKKRIFRMAPIHHHFEALGWPESKIIARFWICGLVLALFALTTLKLR